MRIKEFHRIVIMAVDRRFPSFPEATARLLREHGARHPQIFLNGRGVSALDPASYDLLHSEAPPATWALPRSAYDYWMAYRAVLKNALEQGVDSVLIVEDDIAVSDSFEAIALRAEVPADWQMLYFGCFRYWELATPPRVGPYVIRLNGEQPGSQAIGYRPEAMRRVLALPIEGPLDWGLATLHGELATYCFEPSLITQEDGVISSIE